MPFVLTKEKIEKLKKLEGNEKFINLLNEAINSWQIYPPIKRKYGIMRSLGEYIISFTNKSLGCCMLGAALIGKQSDATGIIRFVMEYFKLSELQVFGLIRGFDQESSHEIYLNRLDYMEAYKFSNQVSQIVFDETKENQL